MYFLLGLAAGTILGYWSHASTTKVAGYVRKGVNWALGWIGYVALAARDAWRSRKSSKDPDTYGDGQ
jgi:hypothetical protein